MATSMHGKTVLITGGNSGIGKETAVGLARAGGTVVFTSRDPRKGEEAAADIHQRSGADVHVMRLDLASFASIRAFAAGFLQRFDALHVLISNAGLILSKRTETEQGFETTFGVNHLGHFLLTDLLLGRIKASAPARIINVSSRVHRRAGVRLRRRGRGADTRGRGRLRVPRPFPAGGQAVEDCAKRRRADAVSHVRSPWPYPAYRFLPETHNGFPLFRRAALSVKKDSGFIIHPPVVRSLP